MSSLRVQLIALCLLIFGFAFGDSDENTVESYTCGSLMTPYSINYGARYTRLIRLAHSRFHDGRLIATFENWPLGFRVYASDDDGVTWEAISLIKEQFKPADWYAGIEPDLYELPSSAGDLPAGALLIATNVRLGTACSHELYVSLDGGSTWKFRSQVDYGDTAGKGGIWEPNLLQANNHALVCFYSDERHKLAGYNQLLGMKVSYDGGISWGPEQYVVAIPGGVERPGMAVTQALPGGRFIMSYECVGATYMQPVRIRFSSDGLHWGNPSDYGTRIFTSDGSYPGATPFVTFLPKLGPNGTLVVSGRHLADSPNSDRELFINTRMGVGPWSVLPSPVQWQAGNFLTGWSMGMIPTANGLGLIQLGCGRYGSTSDQAVFVGREDIPMNGIAYSLENSLGGEWVTVPDYPNQHGATLVQEPPAYSVAQKWTWHDLGDEIYTLTNAGNGLTIDDYGWNQDNDAALDQWDYNGLAVQQFNLLPVGDGSWKFRHVYNGRFMTPYEGSTVPGSELVLADAVSGLSQNWFFRP